MHKSIVLFMAVSALARSAAAQTLSVSGGSEVGGWGVGGIQTVGQTFTALNSRLDSFSVWLRSDAGPPINFIAYVFQWDDVNRRATGPALYQSALMASPPPPPPPLPPPSPPPPVFGFVPYTFMPAVSLSAGGQYVAFLSVVGFNGLFASIESSATDVYASGTFVFTNLPPTVAPWNSFTGSDGSPPPRDLRFAATFSAVPEPASLVLMTVGLLALGAAAHRRRKGA